MEAQYKNNEAQYKNNGSTIQEQWKHNTRTMEAQCKNNDTLTKTVNSKWHRTTKNTEMCSNKR
jgi:hypothetical protein